MQKTKKLKSYFAHRFYFISLIIMILPLFIYTLLLYRSELNQKTKDLYVKLNIILDEKKVKIDQDLELKEKQLSSVERYVYSLKDNQINGFLTEKAKEFSFKDLFILELENNNNLICTFASNDKLINDNFSYLKILLNKNFILFENQNITCKDCVFFSKRLEKKEKNEFLGVLVASFSKEELVSKTLGKKRSLPINVSISDFTGKVIISSDPKLKFITTQKNKFNQISRDKKFIAVQEKLSSIDAYLTIDVDNGIIFGHHKSDFLLRHSILLGIFFIISLVLSFILYKLLSKPIDNLLIIMKEIKQGNLSARYQKHRVGFEINNLGIFFNDMMQEVISHQKRIEEEKLDKQRYIDQLLIAKEIQLSMLPKEPLDINQIDIATGYIPAKEVGGDFYDYFKIDDKIVFIVSDIVGKGIPACLYSLNLRSILRAYATYFTDLQDILINTNNLFLKDSEKEFIFATLWIGILDLKTNLLTYANAGHPPAIIRKKDGSLIELEANGKALGFEKIKNFEIKKIHLQKEDVLFIYSDGIIDAIDLQHHFYSKEKLLDFLKNTGSKNSSDIVSSLFYEIKDFSKDVFQYDDMTILCVKFLK
ncbi:MAG: PP2C family protein-serine/threonine phosphatase [Parachlamydiales bacterium]|nr:PP2C family protein-serine/threonine phosphatase [Parachlamydiales bacterium]